MLACSYATYFAYLPTVRQFTGRLDARAITIVPNLRLFTIHPPQTVISSHGLRCLIGLSGSRWKVLPCPIDGRAGERAVLVKSIKQLNLPTTFATLSGGMSLMMLGISQRIPPSYIRGTIVVVFGENVMPLSLPFFVNHARWR